MYSIPDTPPISPHTNGSPGHRNGVIVNFFDLNEQQLAAMASDLSLAMHKDDLARCQIHFSKSNLPSRFPTLYEIDFLDAIVRHRRETADSLHIGRTNTGHAHLSATREDFLQKLRAICPNLSQPISLPEAAEVASRYLDSIGIGHERPNDIPSTVQTSLYPTLPPDIALLLLLPRDDSISREDAMRECLADRGIVSSLLRRGRIASDGIALTMAKETRGVHVNLAALGSTDPFCLLRDYVGADWVAVHRNVIVPLCESFATHGFTALFFASTTDSGMLTLERGEHPPLFLMLKLLSDLNASSDAKDFQLPDTDERPAPFFESLYDALMLAILGCAGGVRRVALAPSVDYTFPRAELSETACGRNLETILGVYRAWIELCVSDHAKVHFSEEVSTPSWLLSLPQMPIADRRTKEDSQVYWIPLAVNHEGMPDFSFCRSLCDTLTSLSADGKILACKEADKETIALLGDPSVVRALLMESEECLPFAPAPRILRESFFEPMRSECAANE